MSVSAGRLYCSCIETPLGRIRIELDGWPLLIEVRDEPLHERWPVDANKRFRVHVGASAASRLLVCRFEKLLPCEQDWASGECLEAVEFASDDVALILAASCPEEYDDAYGTCGYTVDMEEWGLSVRLAPASHGRDFVFGVSWISGYNDESRVWPWLVVEPTVW